MLDVGRSAGNPFCNQVAKAAMHTIMEKKMKKMSYTISDTKSDVSWFVKVILLLSLLLIANNLRAQSLTNTSWDLGTATGSAGYINWNSGGAVTLTDTTTGSGCQGSAVTETSGYNPTTNFNMCFRVFFGCPGHDVIGSLDGGGCPTCPYTDENGDGMAFSFWKNDATYNANNGNTCGGGLGYDNALTGGSIGAKMVTIEFDTYSSLGTSTVDGSYGGGAPGSGSINDEISVHKDQNSNDLGLLAGSTKNAGNLEDGLEHEVCINYNATSHLLNVTIDGVSKLTNYNLSTGLGMDMSAYFGGGATLNYTWSAGKYGAKNMQSVAPTGVSIFDAAGHNFCTNTAPVKLISFSGRMLNETVLLNWSTAEEKDNKEFIIERSSDAHNWFAIGTVPGNGTVQTVMLYDYTDYSPLTGTSYYRLRQVDIDGKFEYSKVVVVEKTTTHHIQLMPNPFDEEVTISSDRDGKVNVQIYDVLGKVVYATNIENSNGLFTIRPELPSGTYIITVQTDTFVEQQKIIRK